MRFRCSGNGCPIRGPLCICSPSLWGAWPSPALQIAVWIRTKRTHEGHLDADRGSFCTCPHYRVSVVLTAWPNGTSPHPHQLWKLNGTRQLPLLVITAHAVQSYYLLMYAVYPSSPSSPYLNKGHGHPADN